MTREKHRRACIEANALALARSALVRKDLQSLDELGLRLKQRYLSAGQEGFDALHDVAHVCPVVATEKMLNAAARYFSDPLTAYEAIAVVGRLTNPPEEKP